MNDSISDYDIPKRTAELLESLIRAETGGPNEASATPWLRSPLVCFPAVAPILPSSRCFLELLKAIPLEGMAVLDFGTGSGILAFASSKLGAEKIDAIDVNPKAIAAARANAQLHKLSRGLQIFPSDGFAAVRARYDVILANLPIVEGSAQAGIDYGLYDPAYALHRHFFSSIHQHLKPGGSAYICHAEIQAKWSFSDLESLASQFGLHCGLAYRQYYEEVEWRIYRLGTANPIA